MTFTYKFANKSAFILAKRARSKMGVTSGSVNSKRRTITVDPTTDWAYARWMVRFDKAIFCGPGC